MRVSIWVATGCVAATAMVSLWMANVPAQGQGHGGPLTVQMPDAPTDDGDGPVAVLSQPDDNAKNENVEPVEQVPGTVSQHRTEVARAAATLMDQEVNLSVSTKLGNLAEVLSKELGIAVLLDTRAIAMTGELQNLRAVEIRGDQMPLRTVLKKSLQPLGLRAEVQDEGLVITADFTELSRQGILTDKWVGISDELAAKVEQALDTTLAVSFNGTPLDEAVSQLAAEVKFPIVIERTALESHGLATDNPIAITVGALAKSEPAGSASLDPNGATLRAIFHRMLRDLELTFTFRDGFLVVTTHEDAETQLRSRVYFLEGTGLPRGDYKSTIEVIQTSIEPDFWEVLGGVGTIAPLGDGSEGRPALLVSATTLVHEQIEALMKTLRDTHFGPDPIAPVPPNAIPQNAGGGS